MLSSSFPGWLRWRADVSAGDLYLTGQYARMSLNLLYSLYQSIVIKALEGLFGPSTKNTTLRSIPPGLKRLGANLAMLVKEIELLRTNPDQIWIRHC
jgi:hypothetical protein